MNVWTVPRESVELVGPITVTDGETPVTGFEVALLLQGARPAETDWAAPDAADGGDYVLIGPGTAHVLTPGTYRLWARYTASPETPVLDNVGAVVIT